MLPGKKLSQREAALLDILSRSRGTATDAVTALGLKQVADSLPDDVAIVSIARKWNRAVR
jgi:hypothetical protein